MSLEFNNIRVCYFDATRCISKFGNRNFMTMCMCQNYCQKGVIINIWLLINMGYNWKVAAVKVQDYGYQNEEEKET